MSATAGAGEGKSPVSRALATRSVASLSLAVATIFAIGCGGRSDPPAPSAVVAAPPLPSAQPTRHPGLPARALGPEIVIPAEQQAAASALLAPGLSLSGTQEYGAAAAYLLGSEANAVPPAQLQLEMLWLARSSADIKTIVAAVTRLGMLGSTGTDWPAANEDLLIGLISHADPHVSSAAVYASQTLLRSDADVSALLREAAIKHAHPVVRAHACSALGRRTTSLTDDAPSLAALVGAIDDEAPIVSLAALTTLGASLWSTHLPADTHAKLLAAARSPVALVRAAGLSNLASFVASQPSSTPEQRAQASALLVAAFSDADPWVRVQAMEMIDLLRGRAANFDAIVAKLDDGAPLAPSLPYESLVLQPDAAPQVYAMAVSSGYQPNTAGNYVLRGLVDYARQGDSGRIPPEARLTMPADAPSADARAAVLAWWAANHDAAIAAALR